MNNVKFAEMRVGDRVEFLKKPTNTAPLAGRIVAPLTQTTVVYTDGVVQIQLRRASLVLDRRDRKNNLWVFE